MRASVRAALAAKRLDKFQNQVAFVVLVLAALTMLAVFDLRLLIPSLLLVLLAGEVWGRGVQVRQEALDNQAERERETLRRSSEEQRREALRQQAEHRKRAEREAERQREQEAERRRQRAEQEQAAERQRQQAEQEQEVKRRRQRAEQEQEAERRRQRAEQEQEAERRRQRAEQEREAKRRRQRAEQERQSHRDEQRERARAEEGTKEWWVVLELSPDASKENIVRSYRSKIKQYHPDRVAGLGPEFIALAESRTKAINAAYAEALGRNR